MKPMKRHCCDRDHKDGTSILRPQASVVGVVSHVTCHQVTPGTKHFNEAHNDAPRSTDHLDDLGHRPRQHPGRNGQGHCMRHAVGPEARTANRFWKACTAYTVVCERSTGHLRHDLGHKRRRHPGRNSGRNGQSFWKGCSIRCCSGERSTSHLGPDLG